jgi:hypothetical protein
MAAVPDRVTEFIVDGFLGLALLAGALYVLLTVFRREHGEDAPPRKPKF